MKLLFVAEAVTLSHVARPLALASGLQRAAPATPPSAEPWQFTLACAPAARAHVERQGIAWQALHSIAPARFLSALSAGRAVYDAATLEDYVADDLRLLSAVRPDLVIGDFRLSLSVSARLAGVPYATLTNAYWSPHCSAAFPLPVLPLSRRLPLPLASALFSIGRPAAMALHCRPLNAVRRAHGLASLGHDLRRVYTDADHVLYADAPGFFALDRPPAHHHFLGPVLWSPAVGLPPWWSAVRTDRPVVYLSLGSSGRPQDARQVADALTDQVDCSVMAAGLGAAGPGASADRRAPGAAPTGTLHAADYLPGDQATARADLVVCNGGSMTCQQALLAGKPVLGIASNMDQFLNMGAIVAHGAGICLRADRLSAAAVRQAATALLGDPAYAAAARRLGARLAGQDAAARLVALLPELARPRPAGAR